MTRLIMAGLVLSILSGVAFSRLSPIDEQRIQKGNAAVEDACNEEILKKFIKCDAIPGVLQGSLSNSEPPRNIFSHSGGVFFATAEPSRPWALSDPSDINHSSDLSLIWKVAGAATGSIRTFEAKFPVYDDVRVAVKFRFKKNRKLRIKEEENLQTLNTFGLAPARYVFGNEERLIKPDVIIMERIDGMTLPEYIVVAGRMPGLEGHDEETRLRLPGLRLLYIYKEIAFLLKRLQNYKWRHCHLLPRNAMMRKSTEKKVRELEEQLRKDKQEKGHMGEAYQEDWLALQFEARLVLRLEGSDVAVYQTNNNQMVFVGVEHAKSVYKMQEGELTYDECPSLPDISSMFMHWKTVMPETEKNLHLREMKEELKKIFTSLPDGKLSPFEEEKELMWAIEDLQALEKKEKDNFIAHLKNPGKGRSETQTVSGLQEVPQPQPIKQHGKRKARMREVLDLLRQQLRESQHVQSRPGYRTRREATQIDRLASGSSKDVHAIQETQAEAQSQAPSLSQQNVFMGALTPPSADNVPRGSRPPSFDLIPNSLSVEKGIPEKQGVLLPKQRRQHWEQPLPQQLEHYQRQQQKPPRLLLQMQQRLQQQLPPRLYRKRQLHLQQRKQQVKGKRREIFRRRQQRQQRQEERNQRSQQLPQQELRQLQDQIQQQQRQQLSPQLPQRLQLVHQQLQQQQQRLEQIQQLLQQVKQEQHQEHQEHQLQQQQRLQQLEQLEQGQRLPLVIQQRTKRNEQVMLQQQRQQQLQQELRRQQQEQQEQEEEQHLPPSIRLRMEFREQDDRRRARIKARRERKQQQEEEVRRQEREQELLLPPEVQQRIK